MLTSYQDYEHEHGPYHDHDHDHDHEHDDDEHDESCPHHGHHHHHCHHHDDDEDDLDSIDNESPIAQRQANAHRRSSPRSPRSQRHSRYSNYAGKSNSAPDGYEAFENTNNKKKRKIPTSGMSMHPSSLNSDFASMGISSRDGSTENIDVSYGIPTSPSGLGVQGAGRGRTGRKSNARNPLGVSTNGTNVRPSSARFDQAGVATTNGELDWQEEDDADADLLVGDGSKADQGIISKAIANATTLLRNPLGKGQENIGVLDQQAKTPTNSQFTFTCESDAKGVRFPEQSLYSPDYATRVNSAPAAAPSQTQKYDSRNAQYAGPGAQQVPPSQQPAAPAANQKQRRRRKGDVYALAARQRKLQQEYANLQHPPSHEDIWICEFCEYESIFGSPPHALVRQYEIKDRKERKRLAEKRRLLEKAKLKGRKGKKQTKNAAKASHNSTTQQPINNQNYDQQPLDQVDDYFDEGYDDDPIPMPEPPPQAPAKQAMPGAYDRGGGGAGRTASAGAAGIAGGGAGGGTIR